MIPATEEPWSCSELTVAVEDVTLADAPSRVVARVSLGGVSSDSGAELERPFAIRVDPVDPAVSYNVKAHASVEGKPELCSGDFVSMQSYPVLTYGYPSEIRVELQKLGG